MPYKSDAQRRFFHSKGAAKAGLSKAEVAKWDKESKGQHNLPEHVGDKAGNTDYLVTPRSAVSVNSSTENVEVPASQLSEVAGTNTSQVVTTAITAYRGSAGDF